MVTTPNGPPEPLSDPVSPKIDHVFVNGDEPSMDREEFNEESCKIYSCFFSSCTSAIPTLCCVLFRLIGTMCKRTSRHAASEMAAEDG